MADKKTKPARNSASGTGKDADRAPDASDQPDDTSADPEAPEPIETAGDTTPPEAKEDDSTSATDHVEAPVGSGDSGLPKKGETDTRPRTHAAPDTTGADGPRDQADAPESDDDTAIHPPATAPAPGPRQSSFGALVLGGLLAAVLGAVAAYILLPETGLLQRPSSDGDAIAALQERLEAQSASIADLEDRVSSAPQPQAAPDPVDLGPVDSALSDLEARMTDFEGSLDNLRNRLSELEARPAGGTGEGTAPSVSSQDIATLRETLETQSRQIDALMQEAAAREAQAQQAASDTLRRAALTRVQTALDTGTAYEDALGDLRDTGAEIPDPLARTAAEGVPTLSALQDSFPDAARAALAAARDAGTDGTNGSGIAGFLSSQLGVRSLEPREGSDPDAVLSRAEAALREGRLGDTLAELETLPEVTRTELSDWMGRATKRLEAVNAAEGIGAQLN